ncbi:YdeI/OmpD-associated family protein [Streptomyces hypolithicus]
MPGPDTEQVYVKDRPAWRQWLMTNAAASGSIWLVFDKGLARTLTYEEIVEEALCFGWIDSVQRSLDDHRSMLYMAPRKPASAWSRLNKERVERLEAAGLMQPGGLAAVEIAKVSGRWTALDQVEQLTEPDDLAKALDADGMARAQWDGFPRSVRRAILEWIGNAEKPQTRAARIAETVTEAAGGRRAHQWRRPKED